VNRSRRRGGKVKTGTDEKTMARVVGEGAA